MTSKLGWTFSLIYIAVAAYLIITHGLFGESFIALILGMPWTLLLAAIEFGGAEGALAAFLLILPILLNAALLYWIGTHIERRTRP